MLKENKVIKVRIPWDTRNLFEHEEDYYKLEYIEYKSKGDRNKTLSVEK